MMDAGSRGCWSDRLDSHLFLRFGVLVGLNAVPRLRFPVITADASLERFDLPSRREIQISTFFGPADLSMFGGGLLLR